MIINTREPISICLKFYDWHTVILVDGIEYAILEYLTNIDSIDIDFVRRWVEETYYSGDYLSPAYRPCRLNSVEVKK